MKTLNIIKAAAVSEGYKAGQSAAEFCKANPKGAKEIADLLEKHAEAFVRELSGAMMKVAP